MILVPPIVRVACVHTLSNSARRKFVIRGLIESQLNYTFEDIQGYILCISIIPPPHL